MGSGLHGRTDSGTGGSAGAGGPHVRPGPRDREVYQQHFIEYKKLYPALKGFYRRMNG